MFKYVQFFRLNLSTEPSHFLSFVNFSVLLRIKGSDTFGIQLVSFIRQIKLFLKTSKKILIETASNPPYTWSSKTWELLKNAFILLERGRKANSETKIKFLLCHYFLIVKKCKIKVFPYTIIFFTYFLKT